MVHHDPSIVSIEDSPRLFIYINDPKARRAASVQATMSDGSYVWLFAGRDGPAAITNEELIGLTAAKAEELARSRD